jgi:hypothetical protein
MWNISQQISQRRGNVLLGLAVLFAVASFSISQFSYELCHSGIPVSVLSIVAPSLGALCALSALFFPSSSTSITAIKAIVVAINLYLLGWAGILQTGMGVLNCS